VTDMTNVNDNEPPKLFDGKDFQPLSPEVLSTLSKGRMALYLDVASACANYVEAKAQLDDASQRAATAADVIAESNAILSEFPKPTRLDLVRDVIASGRQ
jgi:hypothetical protein